MGAFEELSWRGLVQQTTAENMGEVLSSPITVYSGFDPSAPSLHAGNLVPLMMLTHLRRAGHQVLPLIGGATGMIGDPSGKSSERQLLDAERPDGQHAAGCRPRWSASSRATRARRPRIVDNLDWLGGVRLLDFLRDIGKHFAVNQMIQRDSVKQRFESREAGISYTEFSYMLLQAYDFYELHRRHGCRMQIGASDQWGNIVSGVDLVRRLAGQTVYGLTSPLLTDSTGKKYGKSEKGAVYLDPKLTSPYAFYQFWLNSADADVGRFLRWLTVRPREEIEAMEAALGKERLAQRALAEDLTRRVHGAGELARVLRATEALFGGGDLRDIGGDLLDEALVAAPSITVPRSRFKARARWSWTCSPRSGPARRSRTPAASSAPAASPSTASRSGRRRSETRVKASDLIDGRLLVLRRGKRNNYVIRVA